jgi:hypothetical protein
VGVSSAFHLWGEGGCCRWHVWADHVDPRGVRDGGDMCVRGLRGFWWNRLCIALRGLCENCVEEVYGSKDVATYTLEFLYVCCWFKDDFGVRDKYG